jgi:lipopolysaccharide export system permease protein
MLLSSSYILFMKFSSEFAIGGSLQPFFAMWLPNIIFAFVAFFMYKMAPK